MAKYLYNGIELPDINTVWTDKETYPYAYIGEHVQSGVVFLVLCKSDNSVVDSSGERLFGANDTLVTLMFENTGDTWVSISNVFRTIKMLWSNEDIYYGTSTGELQGTLYLAASDPIPVLSLTDSDQYRNVNGKLVKHTLYKKVGGELVPLDDHIMA